MAKQPKQLFRIEGIFQKLEIVLEEKTNLKIV